MNRQTSTSATRRFRADQDNKTRENRARVMSRIGEGRDRAASATLEKYNILPAEVDAAREAVNLPPLYEDNNYQSTTVLENINEATRREIDEVAKQQRLIVELEQDQERLRELQIDAERENEGRIVRIPAAQLYNIHVIKQYLWKNDDRKNRKRPRRSRTVPNRRRKSRMLVPVNCIKRFASISRRRERRISVGRQHRARAPRHARLDRRGVGTEDGRVRQKLSPASLVTPLRMLSVMMELYPTGRSLAKQLPTEYAILQQVKTERELKSQAYLETKKQDANEQLPYDWDELET